MQKIDVPLTFAVSAAVLAFVGEIIATSLNASWLISAVFWTAAFTGALTVSTVALWWQTRKSAQIAERALTDLERPYVFVLDFNWMPIGELMKQMGFAYTVINGGKLPAMVRRVRFGIAWNTSAPPDLEDQPPIHTLLTAPVIGGGAERKVTQELAFEDDWAETQVVQLRDGETARVPTYAILAQLVVKISIEYDGPITKGHETTACWEWHAGKGAFSQHGGEAHNRRT